SRGSSDWQSLDLSHLNIIWLADPHDEIERVTPFEHLRNRSAGECRFNFSLHVAHMETVASQLFTSRAHAQHGDVHLLLDFQVYQARNSGDGLLHFLGDRP